MIDALGQLILENKAFAQGFGYAVAMPIIVVIYALAARIPGFVDRLLERRKSRRQNRPPAP